MKQLLPSIEDLWRLGLWCKWATILASKVHSFRKIQVDLEVRLCFTWRLNGLASKMYSPINVGETTGLLSPLRGHQTTSAIALDSVMKIS